ncbi:MAG: tetratricopeptide repeat protein [Pseudomonadota bacterium]
MPDRLRLLVVSLVLGLFGLSAGCGSASRRGTRTTLVGKAHSRQPREAPPSRVRLEPIRIEVVTTPTGTETRVYDAASLLEQGNEALQRQRYDEALAHYARLLAEFPDSLLASAALYNSGLACEGKGDFAGAAENYQEVVLRSPVGSPDAIDALFHLGAVLAESGRYQEAVVALDAILANGSLPPAQRIEAMARKGYALIELADYVRAEQILHSIVVLYYQVDPADQRESRYFVAMGQYYLGGIPHRQFKGTPLRLPQEQLERDIEQKSELLLLARDRYLKTVDYKEPYWATAAVFQVGAMYKEFWDAFMEVPVPDELDSALAQEEYARAMNQEPQLRRLLEKSLRYHERNLVMAREGRVTTSWSEGSAAASEEVKRILAKQLSGGVVRPGERAGVDVDNRDSGKNEGKGDEIAADRGGGNWPAEYIPARADLL